GAQVAVALHDREGRPAADLVVAPQAAAVVARARSLVDAEVAVRLLDQEELLVLGDEVLPRGEGATRDAAGAAQGPGRGGGREGRAGAGRVDLRVDVHAPRIALVVDGDVGEGAIGLHPAARGVLPDTLVGADDPHRALGAHADVERAAGHVHPRGAVRR